jgi:phosphate transport system substrate-binding protein
LLAVLFAGLAVAACVESVSVRVDGSSTVYPISEAAAEDFQRVSDVKVNIGFSGTGGGLERFCRGEIDISNASRRIEDDEVQACTEGGIDEIVELQVAIDALTVMVNPGNDFADCLTIEQLHRAFTGDAKRWSDLDSSWPEREIALYFPGTDSGTFDYFVEAVIHGVDENAQHTGDGTASEDDNVLAQGISGDPNALGYFGFAYYQEARGDVTAVAIDGGDGCVEPSLDSALDGDYQPLSRPLYIYTSASLLRDDQGVREFVRFYLEETPRLAQDVGYIPIPDAVRTEQLDELEPFFDARAVR